MAVLWLTGFPWFALILVALPSVAAAVVVMIVIVVMVGGCCPIQSSWRSAFSLLPNSGGGDHEGEA